jgi:hypothetical protein
MEDNMGTMKIIGNSTLTCSECGNEMEILLAIDTTVKQEPVATPGPVYDRNGTELHVGDRVFREIGHTEGFLHVWLPVVRFGTVHSLSDPTSIQIKYANNSNWEGFACTFWSPDYVVLLERGEEEPHG